MLTPCCWPAPDTRPIAPRTVPPGFEARGFIFGAPLALALGCAFVPLRKPGKLPGAGRHDVCTLMQQQLLTLPR